MLTRGPLLFGFPHSPCFSTFPGCSDGGVLKPRFYTFSQFGVLILAMIVRAVILTKQSLFGDSGEHSFFVVALQSLAPWAFVLKAGILAGAGALAFPVRPLELQVRTLPPF